jgi:hypothetical protein
MEININLPGVKKPDTERLWFVSVLKRVHLLILIKLLCNNVASPDSGFRGFSQSLRANAKILPQRRQAYHPTIGRYIV